MVIAVYSRGLEAEQMPDLLRLIESLKKYGAKVFIYETLYSQFLFLKQDPEITVFDRADQLDAHFDCFISLGGDGTILDAVTLVGNRNIPILGINFGRLGFLTGVSRDEIEIAVEALFGGGYTVDRRTLIHVDANIPLFGDVPFGLNDFAILKKDTAPMVKIHTYLNGELLNTYWSDGLIVATPTGSTAYNLSCNGPILFPDAGSFVITPIAPHQLNVRPIIVPDSNVVSFEVESRSDEFICSLDARRQIVTKNIQIAIKKENFEISIIRLNESSFLTTMRNKLGWGADKRN